MNAHALRKQGWTITAIANHLDRDRKTVRAYLAGSRGCARRRGRIRSIRSPATSASGWWTIRMCWPPRCSTRCKRWAIHGRIRRSPARSATVGCGRCARRARPGPVRCPPPRSNIPQAKRPSGTGSSCRARRGWTVAPHSCWSARWRTPRAPVGCSATRPIRPTPSTGSIGCVPG